MKYAILISVIYIFTSCVPLSIAPNIKDYKVIKGRKFKRELPKKNAFVFNDPKNAGEFYKYVDAKFGLNNQIIEKFIPFTIDDKPYLFSFYEVEKSTKTVNLIPILIDGKRESKGKNSLLEDFHFSRSGTWYLAITITIPEKDNVDCLHPKYVDQKNVISYLEALKNEYLMTHNYLEILLQK